MNGVACNLESRGFKALCKATEEIVGHVEPYSITGSLPLIRELQVWKVWCTDLVSWPYLHELKQSHSETSAGRRIWCSNSWIWWVLKQTNNVLRLSLVLWPMDQSISYIKLCLLVVMNIFVSPASNWNVYAHLMLLLFSCRLTEDVPRQERVLLVFRHGPRLSGICEHHFTAGRGGLSRLAGIEECLRLELLVLLSESFGTLFISPWHGHL